MPEYIERKELLKSIQSKKMVDIIPNCNEPKISDALYKQGQAIKEIIKTQPKADVVEVVRCGDCENCRDFNKFHKYCTEHSDGWGDNLVYVEDDDYCSFGIKKESEVRK